MYVYALLKNPAHQLKLSSGIAGDLQIISANHLAAVAEPELATIEAIQTDDRRLMQAVLIHDRILCELFGQITILPLRFGTIFNSRSDLLAHLNQRQDEYIEKLQQFEGQAEYMLKAIPSDAPAGAIDPDARGKSYLLAKKKRYQIVQEFEDQQNREWDNLQQAIAQNYPNAILAEPQPNAERFYFLIPRSQSPLLRKNIQTWQQNYPTWQLQLGEPLPPYHFV